MSIELKPIPNPFGWEGAHNPQSDTEECCTHCGKPIENPARSAWVHVIDGGANLAPASWKDDDKRINPGGNMNWFQIGSVCKLKVPESYRKSKPSWQIDKETEGST